MKELKIINLPNKDLKIYGKLDIDREVISRESLIFKVGFHNKKYIIKNFHKFNDEKLYTLKLLNNYASYFSKNFLISHYLVQDNERLVGILLPYRSGITLTTLLNSNKYSLEIKIKYLQEIGEILEYLKRLRQLKGLKFYINDLHDSNFIVNLEKEILYVIDLDSAKIENNVPTQARYLTESSLASQVNKYQKSNLPYKYAYINPDENTDLYCYVIIILNYLCQCNVHKMSLRRFNDLLNYLESIKVNPELLASFERIITPLDNINPKKLLCTLDE